MQIKMMKYLFTNSRSSLFSLLLMTGITICAFGLSQKTFGQQDCPPEIPGEVERNVTVCSLWYALRREALPPEQRNRALINVVQRRGIKFVLTEDEVKFFKDAGANDALIAAISKESAKLERTAFGYDYLGRKHLDLGRKFLKLEEKFREAARESRRLKNEEEAKRNEEEARKNEEEAIKHLERSASFYKEASDLEPDNLISIFNIAVAYEAGKKYDDAIFYTNRVIEREPTPSRHINRGLMYEKKAQTVADKDERKAIYDKAIADYTSALRLDPTNTMALKQRANVHRMWARYEEALEDYNEYLKYNPNSREVTRLRDEVLKNIEIIKNRATISNQ